MGVWKISQRLSRILDNFSKVFFQFRYTHTIGENQQV